MARPPTVEWTGHTPAVLLFPFSLTPNPSSPLSLAHALVCCFPGNGGAADAPPSVYALRRSLAVNPLTRSREDTVLQSGVNPLNNMPPASQEPSPGQRMPLSTTRVRSTIPKASVASPTSADGAHVPKAKHQIDSEETWTYPSEQMFFNAMRRKGWDPSEEDVSGRATRACGEMWPETKESALFVCVEALP